MTDDSIEDYESADLTVVEVSPHEVLVDAGDASASIDTAVRFANGTIGRVVELQGTRRLLVQVFSAEGIEAGQAIDVLAGPAGLARPSSGEHAMSSMNYELEGIPLDPPSPRLQEIDASRPPLDTGGDVRDKLAPLTAGGVNLVINQAVDSMLDELMDSMDVELSIRVGGDADIAIGFEDDWQHLMAMRVGAAWADSERRTGKHVGFVAELPTPRVQEGAAQRAEPNESISSLVNELGRILVSTDDGRITTLLEVDVSTSAVADIAETMGFGEVDAQWFIDAAGRFDPRRSTSRADQHPEAARERQAILRRLDVARKARERAEIFGESELSDDERDALEFAEKLAD